MALKYFIDRSTRLLHRYPPLCDVEYKGQLIHTGVPGHGAGWDEWCPVCKGTKGENLSDIGETFFSAITSIFDALISAATGGILKDFWSSLTEGEEFLDVISDSLHDHVIDLIGNTESTILSAATRLENEVAREFAELLGVTDFQRRLAESLQAEIEAITAKWEKEIEVVEVAEREAAIDLAQRAQYNFERRAELYQNQYDAFIGRIVEDTEKYELEQYEMTIFGVETAKEMLYVDYSQLFDLAEKGNVEAVAGMVAELEAGVEASSVWALELGFKPLAYGEMGMRVLSQLLDMPVGEIKEQLKMYAELQYEIAAEMIPNLTPRE